MEERKMKKRYMTPTIEVEDYSLENQLLVVSAPGKGLGYGGVDTEGNLDPASREFDDLWDE
jgi:hypothetical protein